LSDSYKTAARRSRAEIKIKRSRFIGTIEYTPSIESAGGFISEISKEFYDATHNCYAYRVGRGRDLAFKSADNGEPSGTAGRPILESIEKYELTDTTIVVTRYFGGTKLGTGGLGRAYRETALAAVDRAGIAIRYVTKRLKFIFAHHYTNIVLRTLSSDACTIVDSKYTDVGTVICDIRELSVEPIRQALMAATNARIAIEEVQRVA
jgi:uncharacterized YigZ family protein